MADGRRDDERDLDSTGDRNRQNRGWWPEDGATYVFVLLRFGGLERPVDPLLHIEAVLGERGDILKRPF